MKQNQLKFIQELVTFSFNTYKRIKTLLFQILEALWELKNREKVSRQLLLLIYNEHLSVLTGCRLPRENIKREYLKKCCDEIKNNLGSTIAIASLKHIFDILNSYQKVAIKSLKVKQKVFLLIIYLISI